MYTNNMRYIVSRHILLMVLIHIIRLKLKEEERRIFYGRSRALKAESSSSLAVKQLRCPPCCVCVCTRSLRLLLCSFNKLLIILSALAEEDDVIFLLCCIFHLAFVVVVVVPVLLFCVILVVVAVVSVPA